jgi:hypothetical protein
LDPKSAYVWFLQGNLRREKLKNSEKSRQTTQTYGFLREFAIVKKTSFFVPTKSSKKRGVKRKIKAVLDSLGDLEGFFKKTLENVTK